MPAELLLALLDPLLVPPSAAGPPLPPDAEPPDEPRPLPPLEFPGPELLPFPEGGVVADVPHASAHATDSEIVRMCGLR